MEQEQNIEEIEKGLKANQKRFCEELMVDDNQTQAYIRAGYSENGARVSASQLLSNPNISRYVDHLRNVRAAKVKVRAGDVLQALKDFANADVTETMELSTDEIKLLPKSIRLCIARYETFTRSYDVDEETIFEKTVKVWFVDKLKAMEMINKHIGFYEKDNEQQQDNVVIIKLPDNGRG